MHAKVPNAFHRENIKMAANSISNYPNDLRMICRNNEEIAANKFMLCLYSPLMCSIFKDASSLNNTSDIIILPDINASSISHILSIISSGFSTSVNENPEENEDIIETATVLEIGISNLDFIMKSSSSNEDNEHRIDEVKKSGIIVIEVGSSYTEIKEVLSENKNILSNPKGIHNDLQEKEQADIDDLEDQEHAGSDDLEDQEYASNDGLEEQARIDSKQLLMLLSEDNENNGEAFKCKLCGQVYASTFKLLKHAEWNFCKFTYSAIATGLFLNETMPEIGVEDIPTNSIQNEKQTPHEIYNRNQSPKLKKSQEQSPKLKAKKQFNSVKESPEIYHNSDKLFNIESSFNSDSGCDMEIDKSVDTEHKTDSQQTSKISKKRSHNSLLFEISYKKLTSKRRKRKRKNVVSFEEESQSKDIPIDKNIKYDDVNDNTEVVNNSNDLQCQLCPFDSKHTKQLAVHYVNSHFGEELLIRYSNFEKTCVICLKKFIKINPLMRHLIIEHNQLNNILKERGLATIPTIKKVKSNKKNQSQYSKQNPIIKKEFVAIGSTNINPVHNQGMPQNTDESEDAQNPNFFRLVPTSVLTTYEQIPKSRKSKAKKPKLEIATGVDPVFSDNLMKMTKELSVTIERPKLPL